MTSVLCNHVVVMAIRDSITSLPYFIFYVLIVVDIFCGTGRAIYQKRMNSSTGLSGIIKHMTLAVAIGIIFPIAELLGLGLIIKSILLVIILNYIVSILENIEAVTNLLPSFISKWIYNLKESTVKNIELSITEDFDDFVADIKIEQDGKEQFKTDVDLKKHGNKYIKKKKKEGDSSD